MKTGFIGLGAMGVGMARNLGKHAHLSAVWNRTKAKADALAAELGCESAASPAAIAQACDTVVMCVSADADVLDLVEQIAPAIRPGSIVIDCSTVSAATARTASARLVKAHAYFLDAPVSGGTE